MAHNQTTKNTAWTQFVRAVQAVVTGPTAPPPSEEARPDTLPQSSHHSLKLPSAGGSGMWNRRRDIRVESSGELVKPRITWRRSPSDHSLGEVATPTPVSPDIPPKPPNPEKADVSGWVSKEIGPDEWRDNWIEYYATEQRLEVWEDARKFREPMEVIDVSRLKVQEEVLGREVVLCDDSATGTRIRIAEHSAVDVVSLHQLVVCMRPDR